MTDSKFDHMLTKNMSLILQLDRSFSSTPTANSRSSTPINPRTNYDDDPSYGDWETKVEDSGDKQVPPAVPLGQEMMSFLSTHANNSHLVLFLDFIYILDSIWVLSGIFKALTIFANNYCPLIHQIKIFSVA